MTSASTAVGRDVVDDLAVAEEDDPVGPGSEVGVVGDDDRGDPAVARVEDHLHHGLAVRRVERPRRLVGEEEVALADHGASDRDPLALAAGELIGIVPGPVGEPELLERATIPASCAFVPQMPSSSSGSATFSAAVRPGRRLKSWKT